MLSAFMIERIIPSGKARHRIELLIPHRSNSINPQPTVSTRKGGLGYIGASTSLCKTHAERPWYAKNKFGQKETALKHCELALRPANTLLHREVPQTARHCTQASYRNPGTKCVKASRTASRALHQVSEVKPCTS